MTTDSFLADEASAYLKYFFFFASSIILYELYCGEKI